MQVRVLYFAAVRELLGRGTEELRLDGPGRSLADVIAELARRHPELAARLSSVRFAVNESFASPGDPVTDGDTVAVIPPVSGG